MAQNAAVLPSPLPARRRLPLALSGLALLMAACAAPVGTGTPPPLALAPPAANTLPSQAEAAAPDSADPWGLYVTEASGTFDVPEPWIRAVMRLESGGRAFVKGRPLRGPSGAIGLMQIMPETYAELSRRYGLGRDPADPHDNIMAGTALMRELYEEFGAPMFLVAYNCGSRCASAALDGKHKLSRRTREYLDTLRPQLEADSPSRPGWSIAELSGLGTTATQPPAGDGAAETN